MSNTDVSPGGDATVPSTADVTAEPPAPASEGKSAEPEAGVSTENGSGEAQPTETQEAKEASEAGKKLNERRRSYQERAQELNTRWQNERTRADHLERRVKELEGKIARPDPSKYDDPVKYQADDAAAVAAGYRHEDAKAEADAAREQAAYLRDE